MPVVSVRFHDSQFPQNVRRDLLQSLRNGSVNHKFHYDSIKQAQKWLALHESYSPARTDPACIEIYAKSFEFAAENVGNQPVHLIGLGCGGGQKEAQLLELLIRHGNKVHFTASDVSPALVLVAQERAAKIIRAGNCDNLVCDLQTAGDLPVVLDEIAIAGARRIITFFGLIPNFEPREILSRLSAILRPDDLLLFSANLAPGPDYHMGVAQVLPLYENDLTRDWLMTFLTDLGMDPNDGDMTFAIEDVADLKRITAVFRFARERQVRVDSETFQFKVGETIRLFFSYRHTPATIGRLLAEQGIAVQQQWITPSEEEGVFFCRKVPSSE